MRNWLISTEEKELEYYKGILIHADSRLHEQALHLVQQYVRPGASVLDAGAGAGAFSLRLVDAGYRVVASDVDGVGWQSRSVPFVRADIDHGLGAFRDSAFDAVCCLEVIEHIENPWQLLREISRVLRPQGQLILSTPNVTSFLSRLSFLRTGEFAQFDEASLAYGHISPVTRRLVSLAATRAGLHVLQVVPGGFLPVFDMTSMRPRLLAHNLLRGLAYLAARGDKRGWCLLFVMAKS